MTFKFSVVIPLYNKSQYIIRAINSIFEQKFPVDEIIIVDDGSTDDGLVKVHELNSPIIKIIEQENQGVSIARNTGITQCRNEYILLLDADDYWLSNFTSEIKTLAIKNPDAGILACNYAFKTNEKIIPAKLRAVPKKLGIIPNYFASCVKADLPITASSVALKKSAITAIGGFPVGMKMGEDQLVWSRISYRYQIAFSNTVAVHYDRAIEDSACKTNLITELAPHIKFWQQDLKENKIPTHMIPSLTELLHFSALYCVKNNLKLNNRTAARKLLFNERLIFRDIYWFISIALTYTPTFILKRVL